MKADYQTRRLMLCLTLNQHRMSYTPLSHKGSRAARILAKLGW